jgi:acetylornithine deacetylase/succinyl-diaminopimelate desuccinylase family protein
MPNSELCALVHNARARIVDFAQRLLRAPSLTGQEGQAAELVLQEIERLGYDEAITDSAGNVIARLKGGPGRTALLHAHLDVVDPGDASRWRFAPFSGTVHDGYLWGRGASDDKGCVAAQVYALGLMREAGLTPPGDVYLTAVVGEEVGGIGTRYLSRNFRPDVAVIGEPSHNTLRRGHRGRFEFIVAFRGRSAHASVPHEGRNPHYALARFLLALRDAPKAEDADFGGTTVAPTLIRSDQTSSNVIPAELRLHLDWRNAPRETPAQAQALLERLLAETAEPDIETQVEIRSQRVTSYTGYEEVVQHAATPFVMASHDPLLLAAQRALEEALQRPVPVEVWPFFTDGGFLYAQGIPCLGFGPGEETMAHVLDERLSIEQLLEATAGYMALAMTLGAVAQHRE